MSADSCGSAEAAARRFAGELERLRAGLEFLGVTSCPKELGPVPLDEWPVTAALFVLARELGVDFDRVPDHLRGQRLGGAR